MEPPRAVPGVRRGATVVAAAAPRARPPTSRGGREEAHTGGGLAGRPPTLGEGHSTEATSAAAAVEVPFPRTSTATEASEEGSGKTQGLVPDRTLTVSLLGETGTAPPALDRDRGRDHSTEEEEAAPIAGGGGGDPLAQVAHLVPISASAGET